ncbi:hypothetical protein MAIC_11350 [Mycolicibacterium aichiense]|uniref:Uncharacterized protein n=1 Tax=Mycolicibacterium aichiense TaxID=1799 RepID=A0AAD1M9P8_9MYCO|nr:hypothetical protein MAIC_11350 [Mycolicibacterium aichiense]
MRVGDLMGSDAVHEGQEGATLILVARQRLDGGQANLLSDVVGGETDPLRGPEASPDITDHDGADGLHNFPEGIPAAGHCFSNGGVETFSWNCHRRRYLQRYVRDASRQPFS